MLIRKNVHKITHVPQSEFAQSVHSSKLVLMRQKWIRISVWTVENVQTSAQWARYS